MTLAMFEGNVFSQRPEPARTGGGSEGESLREISWSDLRARLDAARDLRASLAQAQDLEGASFDLPAARCIAALGDGKDVVNRTDLANGKGTCAIAGPSHVAVSGRDLRI